MSIYKVYSPNLAPFKPVIFDNEDEAYDYYDAMIIKYLSKDGYNGVRLILEKDGEIIDSGSFIG